MSDNLENRIQLLEDTLAIQTLKYTYLNACDAKDVAKIISTFVTSGCMIDYGPVGSFTDSRDLAEVFQEIACHDYMLESHHAHNPIINIIDRFNWNYLEHLSLWVSSILSKTVDCSQGTL